MTQLNNNVLRSETLLVIWWRISGDQHGV